MRLVKTAFRSLWKFRLYTIVNIIGLAVSLGCVILIARYVHQETTVNHFVANLDRVCMMTIEIGNSHPLLGSISHVSHESPNLNPLADPSVQKKSLIHTKTDGQILVNNRGYSVKVFAVDSVFLQIIPYPIALGSDKILAPEDAIITERMAKILFGDANPIGMKINYGSNDVLNIIGVLDNPATKSSFEFDMLVNSQLEESMGVAEDYDIVLLHKGADVKKFNEKYSEFRSLLNFRDRYTRFQLLPLRDFYFKTPHFNSGSNETILQGNRTSVLVLSIIGALILLVGLLNFMNIYTVITLSRGREFGIKKIYGVKGLHLFGQLYLENLLMVIMAVFGAWFMLEISGTFLAEGLGLTLLPNSNFDVLLSFILIFIFPLITAFIPYLRYTFFVPIISLRSVKTGGVTLITRVTFLFLQYVITFGLIVISMFFMKQLHYMLHSDLGYDTKDVVVCKLTRWANPSNPQNEAESIKSGNRNREIIETIERKMDASPLFSHWMYGNPFYSIEPRLPLKTTDGEYLNVGILYLSQKEMDLFNYQLLEGRLWDSTDVSTQYRFIINETTKKLFNITDIHSTYLQPDQRLWYSDGDMSINPAYEIVAVVKDFNTGHLSKPTIPIVIIYDDYIRRGRELAILAKIVSGKQNEAIEYLKSLNKELYGETDFKYTFMDDEIIAMYNEDKRVSRIFTIFAVIAIFVSCLGLFALSLFDIRQRYREIALRKVNGARTIDVLWMLLKKYMLLLAFAFVVAVPVAYLFIHRYLEGFATKAPISWWLFVVPALVVAGVSLLTLVWQVKRAARINPAEVLKGD